MAETVVTWVQGAQFVATGEGGHSVVLDAPTGRHTWAGFKPSELLLAAVGGCTGVDVADILRKKRQRVTGLRITVRGHQREEHPRAFNRIELHYEVRGHGVSSRAVEQAISLSEEKYCMVAATVRGVATISTSYTVIDEEGPIGGAPAAE